MTQITKNMLLRMPDGKTIRVKSVGYSDKHQCEIACVCGTDSYKDMTAGLVRVSDLVSKIESGVIRIVTRTWDSTTNNWIETIN